jgi:hypothetical protein
MSAPRKYKHTQAWYAEQYGKSLPTIKRWWKAGYPLDDPDAMGEYLSERGRKPAVAADDDTPPAFEPDDVAADRVNRFGAAFAEGEGLRGAIKRLQILEKEAAELLADAMRSHNAKERMNRLEEYGKIVERLRKLEKDNPDIESANSKAILVTEVAEGVTRLLFDIAGRLDALPLRGMQTLVGLKPHEIREELEAEIERVKIPIRECRWMPEEERAKLGMAKVPESGTAEAHPAPKKKPRAKRAATKAKRGKR